MIASSAQFYCDVISFTFEPSQQNDCHPEHSEGPFVGP